MTRSSSSPAPSLALDDVDVPGPADPSIALVRGVTWHIHAGDCWLVTGSPGAGKSTVLQVAAGLVRPIRGTIRLFGADVADLGEADLLQRRSRIGFVFGGGGRLFAHLTVAENLALPLFYHARHPDDAPLGRLEPILLGLGLADFAGRTPRELPRAIAPRVALARALVLAPDILLIDDPAAGLVAEESEWWRHFVAECNAGHCPAVPAPTTLVIAAQDSRPWRPLATRFAEVHDGTWRILGGPAPADPVLRPATAD